MANKCLTGGVAVSYTHLDVYKRQEVQALQFNLQEQPVQVTVSAGVGASSEPQGFLALMRTADKALYEAKRLGRNQVQVHWLQA